MFELVLNAEEIASVGTWQNELADIETRLAALIDQAEEYPEGPSNIEEINSFESRLEPLKAATDRSEEDLRLILEFLAKGLQ